MYVGVFCILDCFMTAHLIPFFPSVLYSMAVTSHWFVGTKPLRYYDQQAGICKICWVWPRSHDLAVFATNPTYKHQGKTDKQGRVMSHDYPTDILVPLKIVTQGLTLPHSPLRQVSL